MDDKISVGSNRFSGNDAPQLDTGYWDDSLVQVSAPFAGRWLKLVSTTNWEKGRIIAEWREKMILENRTPLHYSDEAWAQLVGDISSQHVGRLRRVHQRFSQSYTTYPGLFWSHFSAAVEWDDAEMWLEGASQNGWSVANMRAKRVETLGPQTEVEPFARPSAPFDDRHTSWNPQEETITGVPQTLFATDVVGDLEVGRRGTSDDSTPFVTETELESQELTSEVRPFEAIPTLPDDFSEAMESFKLAIVKRRMSGWTDISEMECLQCLEALKALVHAGAEAPF